MAAVPADRRGQAQLLLGIIRLLAARQRGNLPEVADNARRLQALADAPDFTQPLLGRDLRALALVSLGITEYWTAEFDEAVAHLALGRERAHHIGRPYLEFAGLAYQAAAEWFQSFARAAEHGTQAMVLARRHGWTDEPAAGIASMVVGTVLTWQGRLAEAEPWVQRAERVLRAESHPAAALDVYHLRGMLELGHGRDAGALAGFQTAERLARLLAAPNLPTTVIRAFLSQALVRLGETERAERALADLGAPERARGEIHIALAILRLAQRDPHAASTALAPVLDRSAPLIWPTSVTQAFLLEAIARDTLGDEDAANLALERALDHAEPDGALLWFLLHPAPDLLERHARHRTSHAALLADIQNLLAGSRSGPRPTTGPPPVREPLSQSELRVLRYLPTNLTAPEIAGELSVSRNTVKTHLRNLYAKLDTHRRAEAVARARDLGLLAPRR
jgi:LuxR family transcriptional regulator, maltose regulon positive regulatory protein